ncbi:MAG TPA: hypothetical protein VFT72_12050 [Opitutaceae bacterium]|nr:hypothetical protein [Opitutaceae bacterium]
MSMESASSSINVPAPDATAASPDVAALELQNLVPGSHWQEGKYLIEEVLPDITYGKLLRAEDVATGDRVIIRSFRVSDDSRARAWSRVFGYENTAIQDRIFGNSAEGRRIEITAAPAGKTLLDHFSGTKARTKDVRWVLEQLVSAIGALHERGVAHLNLKPSTIYVREEGGAPKLCIGGLETLVDITRSELTSISVDPFYAPPEGIGLLQHHASPALRAWDWWSVGRILQELILGTHVLGLLIDRDVSRRTPELLIRADQFLREKDIQRSRPGGVELMTGLDEERRVLLRGLLASCRDARWTTRDIQAWLRGETPRERYDLPRATRLFQWNDYGYSLPEIAEHCSRAENRQIAIDQIFGAERADSLFSFIQADSSQRFLADRLRDLTELAANSAFANLPPATVREVLSAVALGFVGGQDFGLRVRGEPVSATLLLKLLKESTDGSALLFIETLCDPTLGQYLSQLDSSASRLLLDLYRDMAAALAQGASNHWLSRSDRAAVAQVCALLLREEKDLKHDLEKAREKYAISRIDNLNTLFQRNDLRVAELALLLFTLAQPEKFEYLTHEAWLAERRGKLEAEAEVLARALTWKNFASVHRFGALLIGPVILHVAFWLIVAGSVALARPGRATLIIALALVAAMFLVRVVTRKICFHALVRRTQAKVSKYPTAQMCDGEVQACVSKSKNTASGNLRQELQRVAQAIKELGETQSASGTVRPPESFAISRVVAIASTLVALACVATFTPPIIKNPPQWPKLKSAWLTPPAQPRSASATTELGHAGSSTTVAPAAHSTAALTSETLDGKNVGEAAEKPSNAKNGKKTQAVTQMSWGFREPLDLPMMKSLEPVDASPEQLDAALEEGASEVAPYIPETIGALIAVRVPTDEDVGLMLFDGKGNKIADRRVYRVAYLPLARSWFMLGGKPAIYLGN